MKVTLGMLALFCTTLTQAQPTPEQAAAQRAQEYRTGEPSGEYGEYVRACLTRGFDAQRGIAELLAGYLEQRGAYFLGRAAGFAATKACIEQLSGLSLSAISEVLTQQSYAAQIYSTVMPTAYYYWLGRRDALVEAAYQVQQAALRWPDDSDEPIDAPPPR